MFATTNIGPIEILNEELVTLRGAVSMDTGVIGLARKVNSHGQLDQWCLVWKWNSNWKGFHEGQQNELSMLDGWEPHAIYLAIKFAIDLHPECAEDMKWFEKWADEAERTLINASELA